MEDFSSRLEKVLEHLQITPYKMAKDIGTSEAVISNAKNGKNKPSYDFLSKILNFYKVLNAEWLITGQGEMLKSGIKNEYTPRPSGGYEIVADTETAYTPKPPKEKLHPKQAEKLHPTLHPTPEKCALCHEKERVIEQQKETIDTLKEVNSLLRSKLEEREGRGNRRAG
ncbi:helix-turn-helix domain-containing protein [Litoribacter populi]|uniref:helix-turn-helix domain-containing protein n=1 Tax=Litoribacter populi TaxID=2598460 RepID=UPI00117CF3A6|nr:helix-turn-helix transcriptional regulator [Litoribacter populi]